MPTNQLSNNWLRRNNIPFLLGPWKCLMQLKTILQQFFKIYKFLFFFFRLAIVGLTEQFLFSKIERYIWFSFHNHQPEICDFNFHNFLFKDLSFSVLVTYLLLPVPGTWGLRKGSWKKVKNIFDNSSKTEEALSPVQYK